MFTQRLKKLKRLITSYSTNNKSKESYKLNFYSNQGFTLLEAIIALVIGAIILAGGITLGVTTIKNGKFVEKAFDVSVFLGQKTTQLFNNANNEIAKIPKDQTRVGSINPEQAVVEYFDLLNESGCVINPRVINRAITNPSPIVEPTEVPTSGVTGKSTNTNTKDSGRGKLGDLGNPGDLGDGADTLPLLDCSISALPTPSNSIEPKFRRQWTVVKDFPSPGDVTFSVVIIAIQTNQIVISSAITKSDGASIKQ
ncbi:MAG: hypothetical protein FD167_2797 [bacterium]|nr:MAG: hypothetical protein FD167_2797 [bacterium]